MAVIEPVEFTSKKRKKILVRSAQKDDAEEAFIQKAVNAPTSFSLVALHCGKVVGTCDFVNFRDPKRSHRGGLGISVHQDFRGEGIGEGLMKVLIRSAQKFSNIKFIELDVMEPNQTAFEMYRKLGFEVVHTTPQAYQLSEGEFVSNISMRLEIKK